MTFRIPRFSRYDDRRFFPAWRSGGGDLITKGVNPLPCSVLAAIGAGVPYGLATGLLTQRENPDTLVGILVMTSCNSVILFVMQRANLGLLGYKKFRNFFPFASGFNGDPNCRFFVTLVILGLIFFLDTRLGQAYIATGDNPDMARALGSNTDRMELMASSFQMGLLLFLVQLMAQQEGAMRMLHVDWYHCYWACSLIIERCSFKCHFDRALLQYCDRIDRLPILIWAVIAPWHQYQLYPNLQSL